MALPTLATARYTQVGTFIGQLILPTPSAPDAPRIPCIVGRGSRYAVARDLQIRRSFVFAEQLTFPLSPPYSSPLQHNAANQKQISRIFRSDGTELKPNQWFFVQNPSTGNYDSVLINPEAFDPLLTYRIDYQSLDRDVLDPLPVDGIREITALGDSPSSPDYTEFQHFFLDYTITTPSAAVTNSNTTSGFGPVTPTVANTGTLVLDSSAAFNHSYTRFYQIRCTGVTGTVGTVDRVASFVWQSAPISNGNDTDASNPVNAPTTLPVTPGPWPQHQQFTISEKVGGVAVDHLVSLEYGIVLELNFGATHFSPNDYWNFNAFGPALFEVDGRLFNEQVEYVSGPVVPGTNNNANVSVDFADSHNPNNTYNSKYSLKATAVAGVNASTTYTQSGNIITFSSILSGLTGNGKSVDFVNPGAGGSALSVVYTGTTLTINLGTDRAGYSWVVGASTTRFKAKTPGSAGLSQTIVVLNPGTPSAPLTTAQTGTVTTISLATNAGSSIISTVNDIISAVNANSVLEITATLAAGAGVDIATALASTALSYASNVTSTFDDVIEAVNAYSLSPLSAALTAGSIDTVVSNTPVDPSNTSGGVDNTGTFSWSEHGTNVGIGGTFNYTQTSTLTSNPAPTASLTNGVVLQLNCTNSNFRIDTAATLAFRVNPTDGIDFTARTKGVSGNGISVQFVDTGAAPPTFTQVGSLITINIDAGVTTITDVMTVIDTESTLVTAALAGAGATVIPTAYVAASLSGGIDGDSFDFDIDAPRQFYQGKDSRNVTLTVSVASNASAGAGLVSGSFGTNTPEGSFGTFQADFNVLPVSNSGYRVGVFTLPGNLIMFARNMIGGPTTSTGGNRHVAANVHTFAASLDGTLNWSLTEEVTETINLSDILVDLTGAVTGTPGTRYLILQNIPDVVNSVRSTVTGANLSYTLLLTGAGDNTQYITFASAPTSDVIVNYVYKSREPAPGAFYFLSGKYLRPTEMYNTPILISSADDGRQLLDPPELENHLSIANEIIMGDIGAPAMYIIQVSDPDGDGVYTDVDFRTAIRASESPAAVTDLVVLSHFSNLQDQLNNVTSMADPFKQRFRLAWIGAPIGTPIGDEDTPGSLVYLAQRTLQVFGTSPAHGTRILVSPTFATRDIMLENNTVVNVTLDGSFVAAALAGLVASFTDPGDTPLRKNLAGFKTIQTYGEQSSPDNLMLGASSIVYLTNRGSGVYRIEEDITVDSYAPDFNLINNMTQKMYATKYITDELDAKVIGTVVPSASAGVALIQGFLVGALKVLVSRGIVGAYQSDDGSERPLDPSADIKVFRDDIDPTQYHILYSFYLRSPIKRITGLYVVNTNSFGTGG